MQEIREILEQFKADLLPEIKSAVREEVAAIKGVPDLIYGTAKAFEFLNENTQTQLKSRQTLTNYLSRGKVPYVRKNGREYIFSGPQLLEWDAMGRPPVSEMISENI